MFPIWIWIHSQVVLVTGWVGTVDAEGLSGASFHDVLSGLEAHEVRSDVPSPMGSSQI